MGDNLPGASKVKNKMLPLSSNSTASFNLAYAGLIFNGLLFIYGIWGAFKNENPPYTTRAAACVLLRGCFVNGNH
jgi:hypothetical protein